MTESNNTFDENLELSKSLTASVWERLENLGMAKGGPGSGPHKGGGSGKIDSLARADYHQNKEDMHRSIAQSAQTKINEIMNQPNALGAVRKDPALRQQVDNLVEQRDANSTAADVHGEVASDYRSNDPADHAIAENNANTYAERLSAKADKINAKM